jgi:hypothetical protein
MNIHSSIYLAGLAGGVVAFGMTTGILFFYIQWLLAKVDAPLESELRRSQVVRGARSLALQLCALGFASAIAVVVTLKLTFLA